MSFADPQDEKLFTLARSAYARIGAAVGAAVRDETGRSYTGAELARDSISMPALTLAVANALAAGAERLEAAVVVTTAANPTLDDWLASEELRVMSGLTDESFRVYLCGPGGPVGHRDGQL